MFHFPVVPGRNHDRLSADWQTLVASFPQN